jgi:hypothetical protein
MRFRIRPCLLLLGLTPALFGQGKPATATKLYVDPQTGVSFRYPAAWTEKLAGGYGADPLEEEKGKDNASPAEQRLRVGWVVGTDEEDKIYKSFVMNGSSFAYALLPEKTAEECRARFDGWSSLGKPTPVVLNGVSFHSVQYSDAGLGHSWQFDLYTTFRGGRCLGFSVGQNWSHSDEPFHMSKADEAVPSDSEQILKTLRFR